MSAAEYRAMMQRQASAPSKRTRRSNAPARDPQAILTEALRARLGAGAVQSEVAGLVPGRKFRADIVIPAARLIVEFDGFQYHRSKAAFQKDRERQNLLVEQGWRVLRFFNAQVRNDLHGVVAQILSIALKTSLPPHAD